MSYQARKIIDRNIAVYGHHVYLVTGKASPRYAYTIGLTNVLGAELVLAGAAHYNADEVRRIINGVGGGLKAGASLFDVFDVPATGSFSLAKANSEWVQLLMLGALDYYGDREVAAYQILPDAEHWTIDTPNMQDVFEARSNAAWRWLREDWPWSIPKDSLAVTNLAALRGGRVTEAARWANDEWELFAGPGPDVKREDTRVVPLGVLLGYDDTLNAVARLEVNEALWRDGENADWNRWERSGT